MYRARSTLQSLTLSDFRPQLTHFSLSAACLLRQRGFTGNLVLTTAGERPFHNNAPENRPNQDVINIQWGTATSHKIYFADLLRERGLDRDAGYLIGLDYALVFIRSLNTQLNRILLVI